MSERYRYEEKKIPLDKIKFDPTLNPRRLRPPPELLRQIRDMGVKNSPIVYFNGNSGYYYAVDGWQRVQAAREEEIPIITCEVYKSKADAQIAAIHDETRTPETDLQKYRRFYVLYNALIEEAMPDWQALWVAMRKQGLKTIDAAKRRIDIFKLPPIVLSLMEDKNYHTKDEWNILEKYFPSIRMMKRKLNIREAASIANNLNDRSVEDQLLVAGLCIGLRWLESEEFIRMVAANPKVSPIKVYRKFIEKPTEVLQIKIPVTKQMKSRINRLCEATHKDLKDLFIEFIEGWLRKTKT